jgi:hypothetical protein
VSSRHLRWHESRLDHGGAPPGRLGICSLVRHDGRTNLAALALFLGPGCTRGAECTVSQSSVRTRPTLPCHRNPDGGGPDGVGGVEEISHAIRALQLGPLGREWPRALAARRFWMSRLSRRGDPLHDRVTPSARRCEPRPPPPDRRRHPETASQATQAWATAARADYLRWELPAARTRRPTRSRGSVPATIDSPNASGCRRLQRS